MNRLNAFAISLCFMLVFSLVADAAILTSTASSDGGSVISRTETSMERSSSQMTFGPNWSGSYTYDGSTSGTVTVGRTIYDSTAEARAIDRNYISTDRTVINDVASLSYDGAGMAADQKNVPTGICDTDLSVGLGNTTLDSVYPYQQRFDGEVIATTNGYSEYQAGVLAADEVVGVSGRLIDDMGYSTMSGHLIASADKGFDNNKSVDNWAMTHKSDYMLSGEPGKKGIDSAIDFSWDGFSDAYDEILNESVVDKTLNESRNGTYPMNMTFSEES